MKNRKHPISCFVIAYNEADRIGACLASLHQWVDQLIVLDSGSTDNTVAIAKQYTDEVYCTDWPGYGVQRNRALAKCRHDWILYPDADEVLSDALKLEIDGVLNQDQPGYNLIKIPWKTMMFGKPLAYGRYTALQEKLFYKPAAKFKEISVHETLDIQNPITYVTKERLLHYSWRSYQHLQDKHLQYAMLFAKERFEQGKRSSIGFALINFLYSFLWQYCVRLGCLDGKRGLVMAMTLAQYEYHKYAGIVALQLEERSKHNFSS